MIEGYANSTLLDESMAFNKGAGPEQGLKNREAGMALASIAFLLGVMGNGLAVSILVAEKYRAVRPPALNSPARTPSPVSRRSAAGSSRQGSMASRGRDEIRVPRRRGRDNLGPFRTLLLALVSVDLAGTLVTSPVTFHLYLHNVTIKKDEDVVVCRYSAFVMMFLGLATMASLTTMALERLFCIHWPFRYHRQVTTKKANLTIIVVLLVCAIVCALPAGGVFSVDAMYPKTWCFANWHSKYLRDQIFNYIFAGIGILLIATTLVCNIFSVAGLYQMRYRRSFIANSHQERIGIEMQNIIQLVLMTAIYIMCWTPLVIRILENQITLEENGERDRVAVWLATINPILDPWVYILFRRRVYNRLQAAVRALPCFAADADVTVNLTPPTPIVSVAPQDQEMNHLGARAESSQAQENYLLPNPVPLPA